MILVVDDDAAQRRMTGAMLTALNRSWLEAGGGHEALELLHGPHRNDIKLILLDLMMPDMNGEEFLKSLKRPDRRPPVLMLTAHGSVSASVSTMRAGAQDFLIKPISTEKLEAALSSALQLEEIASAAARARPETAAGTASATRPEETDGTAQGFDALIAEAPATQTAIDTARRAANSLIPVLIQGESGVGKEVFAKALHHASDRAGAPFVAVNCGALPENLVESILFGHEKGAFTGAVARRIGKFEEANGGVLFLDEIGELPLDAQVKLLRAIQEGEVDPVGGPRTVKTDIRLISATNRDLWAEVRAGRFREDLFYRISVFPLTLPPLRERVADIAPLATRFIQRIARKEGKKVDGLAPDALTWLAAESWPGNVRQLENAVHRAVVLSEGPRLSAADFGFLHRPRTQAAPAAPSACAAAPHLKPGPETEAAMIGDAVEAREGPDPAPTDMPAKGGEGVGGAAVFFDEWGHIRPLADIEADVVEQAMTRYGGAMSEAARRLGIGRSTLYRKTKGDDEADGGDEGEGDHAPFGAAASEETGRKRSA